MQINANLCGVLVNKTLLYVEDTDHYNNNIVGTVIIYQSTEIRTGPLYYTIVGTVILIPIQSTKIRTGPLYYSKVGTVTINITLFCGEDTEG